MTLLSQDRLDDRCGEMVSKGYAKAGAFAPDHACLIATTIHFEVNGRPRLWRLDTVDQGASGGDVQKMRPRFMLIDDNDNRFEYLMTCPRPIVFGGDICRGAKRVLHHMDPNITGAVPIRSGLVDDEYVADAQIVVSTFFMSAKRSS